MKNNNLRVRIGCFFSSLSMSVVANFPPLLFLTFREMYGISYSLLGLLVLINYCTQLGIDLIFSFFSHKFNIPATVKAMPLFTILGLLLFAGAPILFPQAVYFGVALGTFFFSFAAGLAEVLISPIIAALPSKDPDREMSKLHSIYAWGVVGVVIFSSLFLLAFGGQNWQVLALLFLAIPLCAFIFFCCSTLPEMETPEKTGNAISFLKDKGIWLCFFMIFMGGSAECTMAQWSSGYLELALGIPKIWGDIFGVALFAAMLGLGRTLYSKFGNRIERVLFFSALGATACYLIAALSPWPILGLLACVFTGLTTAMLWPGSLTVAASRYPAGGVFIYALMAAGGDTGASMGSQIVGLVTDFAMEAPALTALAQRLSLSTEQLGMKLGMLIGMIFPLICIFLTYQFYKKKRL